MAALQIPKAAKRRRIEFVSPSTTNAGNVKKPTSNGLESHDLYYSIIYPGMNDAMVFSQNSDPTVNAKVMTSGDPTTTTNEASDFRPVPQDLEYVPACCVVCGHPRRVDESIGQHEVSFVHQLCKSHSHPPSAIDRRGKGFTYLSAHGWDPDERLGLGASGEGRLHPIQPKVKKGKDGIGVVREEKDGQKGQEEPPVRLTVEGMRKLEIREKKKHEKLQHLFSGNDDVNRHLGIGL